jgi:hypothetical protein
MGTTPLPVDFALPGGPRRAWGPTTDSKHPRTEDFGEGSDTTAALIETHKLPTTLPTQQQVGDKITPVKGAWPAVKDLDLGAFRKIHPDDLALLLKFCIDDKTADGLLFLIAAENLLATEPGSAERTLLASKMHQVFIGTASNPPSMEVNLSSRL